MGYFGAWASVQFDLEQLLGRLALTAALVLFHSLALTGPRHVLAASPPPFSRSISTAPGVQLDSVHEQCSSRSSSLNQGRENATRASLSGAFSILA